MTVTGCLQKGDEPNEFLLSAQNGKAYGLRSKSVDLAPHLGHTISVTGSMVREKDEDEESERNEKNEKKESGKHESADLQVSSMKMISSSCQQ